MANQFINLPALAANGPGAWVDTSSFGGLKTITVEPNGDVFSPFITVECSNQDTPTVGYPIATFQQAKDQTFEVACHWMRAVTSNYKGGGAPVVAVGGTTDGTSSAQLVAPSGGGLGAAVDVSGLENFKTVQIAGRFGGTINILVSEDGGASYNGAFSFQGGPGTAFQSALIAADFMRVERVGVPMISPGLPVVWVSGTSAGGGGGGGGGSSPKTARYTATGGESAAGFPIVFADLVPPIVQADTNYNAVVSGGGLADTESFDAPITDYLTTQITCVPSGSLTAGDVLIVTLFPFKP